MNTRTVVKFLKEGKKEIYLKYDSEEAIKC